MKQTAGTGPTTHFDLVRDSAPSNNSEDESSSKSSKSTSKWRQKQLKDENLSFDIRLDPSDGLKLKNETVLDYAIPEVVDLIEILKSEHEINRNICSPNNNVPDNGHLSRLKTRRSNAPPQNEIAHDYQATNVTNTILLQVRLKTRKKKKIQARFLSTEFCAEIPRKRMAVSPDPR